MNIALPTYIEKDGRESPPIYTIRPLFASEPVRMDSDLERGMSRFTSMLRRHLLDLSGEHSQRHLIDYTWAPELQHHILKLDLDLRKRRLAGTLCIITFTSMGRRIASSPSVPSVWFELQRGETLATRAQEIYAAHFTQLMREKGEDAIPWEDFGIQGSAWVTTTDVVFQPRRPKEEQEDRRIGMVMDEAMDGRAELERVGRSLDALYPGRLERVVGRETEVATLARLLADPVDRRPVVLLGPPQVGKTAIVHEVVHGRVSQRRRQHRDRANIWLVAPQRLISGMSYVGQWENRLLAIVAACRKADHVLYVDDLLGLFLAGQSASSSLSVAQVLKPYLERGDLRLMGEITPTAWSRLRELDRGFADLFHVLHVREPSEEATWRILIAVQRRLESKYNCQFNLDVLPTVVDLQRRYARDAAFPGKAASLLQRLAAKHSGNLIDRTWALFDYHFESGLNVAILDPNIRLKRSEVTDALSQRLVGQDAAMATLADVIAIAKARLNDPGRPLGTMLFIGPTGVGKTECAKALAHYLFGSDERLIRFDMNEFQTADAVARLVGTAYQPEGLLTSAIRHQPFAVLLLDEIEKAHRDVFDLLLQVLDDGRLTDSLGRTSDFSRAIIVMTSNLGAGKAGKRLGFTPTTGTEATPYMDAVEGFFRPEFVNRIDHIVPFAPLRREELARIARMLVDDVIQRDGLARRQMVLRIDDDAISCVVDAGYHPLLGARAMRRAVEDHLTGPIAAELAGIQADQPIVLQVSAADGVICTEVRPLAVATHDPQVAGVATAEQLPTVRTQILDWIEQVHVDLAAIAPAGAISPDDLSPAAMTYFHARDLVDAIRHRMEKLELTPPPPSRSARRSPVPNARRVLTLPPDVVAETAARMMSPDLSRRLWRTWRTTFNSEGFQAADVMRNQLLQSRLVDLLATHPEPQIETVVLSISGHSEGSRRAVKLLMASYQETLPRFFGLTAEEPEGDGATRSLRLRGVLARTIVAGEAGLHVVADEAGVWTMDVQTWPRLDAPPRVIRAGRVDGVCVDFRSGLATADWPLPHELRLMVLAGLPLPEFEEEPA